MNIGFSLKRVREFDVDISEQPSQKWQRTDETMALQPQFFFPEHFPPFIQSRKKKREEFSDEMMLDVQEQPPKKRACNVDWRNPVDQVQEPVIQIQDPFPLVSRKTKREEFFSDEMSLDDLDEPSAKRKRTEGAAAASLKPFFQIIPTSLHSKIIAQQDSREDLSEEVEKFYQNTEKVDKSWQNITQKARMGRVEEKDSSEIEQQEHLKLKTALEYAKKCGQKLLYANLSRYKYITDDQIEALVFFCPNILVLKLKDALISDYAFTYLSRLQNLETLEVRWCEFIQNPDAIEECLNLKKLLFSSCRGLMSLPPLVHLPKLESVEFKFCNQLKQFPAVHPGVKTTVFNVNTIVNTLSE